MIKRILKYILYTFLLIAAFFVITYAWISFKAYPYSFEDIDDLPQMKYAVLLGTSEKIIGGHANMYFVNRIDAVSQLYLNKKVQYILVSGDHSEQYYNEPKAMKNALMNKGVLENDIILDDKGVRTFDSVIRAKYLFEIDSFIIVSQKFHIERALFISRNKNIHAIGFAAKDPDQHSFYSPIVFREILARFKSILDVYILNPNVEVQ